MGGHREASEYVHPFRRTNDALSLSMSDSTSQRSDVERILRRRSDKLEARVEELMREVYALTRKVARVERQERRRISKLLHDEIQQRIFGIGLHVSLARQDARAGKKELVLKDLATVEKWLNESMEILRELAVDLRPQAVQDESLAGVLDQLVVYMNELHGLNVEMRTDHRLETTPEGRMLLYEVVRELLFNVVKHAGVNRATMDLRNMERHVEVRVADQGAGFDPDVAVSQNQMGAGLGLAGLRERLRAVGGSIRIDSAPGKGTRITIRMPTSEG